jgi:hypothetical protein
MCVTHASIEDWGGLILYLQDVDELGPAADKLYFKSFSGAKKIADREITLIALLNHSILLKRGNCVLLLSWSVSILEQMKVIAVIDGLGGGIGSYIIKAIRENFGESIEIIALGTNATATAAMVKAGANNGAAGENAITINVRRVDIITGSLSIVLAGSMLGEVTYPMAAAVASSRAKKVLLPINRERVHVVNVQREPLPHLIEKLVERIKEETNV